MGYFLFKEKEVVRRKVVNRVPPITPVRDRRRAGSAWDREFLGNNRYRASEAPDDMPGQNNRRSLLDMHAIRVQANQNTDAVLEQEIEEALLGDDTSLLPYQPTATINPQRPRTLAAGYDARSRTMRIKFRDGEYYTYYNIPPSVWSKFERASSPGRLINSLINNFPYDRGLF